MTRAALCGVCRSTCWSCGILVGSGRVLVLRTPFPEESARRKYADYRMALLYASKRNCHTGCLGWQERRLSYPSIYLICIVPSMVDAMTGAGIKERRKGGGFVSADLDRSEKSSTANAVYTEYSLLSFVCG